MGQPELARQKCIYLTTFKWLSSRTQALEDTQTHKTPLVAMFSYTASTFPGIAPHQFVVVNTGSDRPT